MLKYFIRSPLHGKYCQVVSIVFTEHSVTVSALADGKIFSVSFNDSEAAMGALRTEEQIS